MKEMEDLLIRNRTASIPGPPAVEYTVAAVQRRLGPQVPVPNPETDWLPAIAGVATLIAVVAVIVAMGLNLWWLSIIPLAGLPLSPALLRRGVASE